MKAFNGVIQILLVSVLTVGVLTGCGGKEERKAKYMERGKSYLADMNYDKARIEFKNVLQIDPKDAEGYLYLGEIEEKQKNWAKAFSAYRKSSELDPELVEPRLRLANFYLAQASVAQARKDKDSVANALGLVQEQIKEVRARDPENLELLALEAALWVNDGEKEKALPQLEKVVRNKPGLRSAAMLLSSLYDEAKRTDDAERVLVDAIKASSEPVPLQQQLVAHYISNKQNDKAEAVLRQIVEANPDELKHRVALASFLSRTDQLDKAEQVLNEAIAAKPDDIQRYLLLSRFVATNKGNDAAIEKLKQLVQQQPDLTDLQLTLVEAYLSNGQKDEARQLLQSLIDSQGLEPAGLKARVVLVSILAGDDIEDKRVPVLLKEVLDANPRDNDALLLKGKLAMHNGDYIDAINSFRSVLKDQPDNTDVLQLLAAAHIANKEDELAMDTLRRGIENNPDNIKLRLSLANMLAKGGDIDATIDQLDAVLKTDEFNLQALKAKFKLLMGKGDLKGMEEVARLMQKGYPDSEDGYIREARLRLAQKNYDAALVLLDDLLAKNPESVAALMTKSDVLAIQKRYADAIKVVEKLQKLSPDNPEAYYRKGRLLIEQGNMDAAMEQYETALEKAPNSAEVLAAIVDLDLKQGKADSAEKRLLAILKENPEHASANDLLGVVYNAQKDYDRAEAAFEKQLEINPRSATVYSQLAQVRIANDDLAGAVRAYTEGLEKLPGDTRLLIGLAGVNERQQDYEAAISVYEKVLELQPDNAVSTNNLVALLTDHRTDAASLDKAIELSAKLERTNQTAFLDTAAWAYYRKGDYDKAVKILERVVSKTPGVPVFHYHLGMAYYKQGNTKAAKEHLGKATDGDYVYQGIDEARATLKVL